MKKALLIAVVALASTSAFASKARRAALANSRHLNDVQDVVQLNKPDKAVAYGEWATLEFGQKSTNATTANAEGGFVRMWGNSAFGAYLGAPNLTTTAYRNSANTILGGAAQNTLLLAENPLRLYYATKAGDLNWGVELYYSTSKSKSGTGGTSRDAKQDNSAVYASASTDVWDAQLGIGLGNNATTTVPGGDNKMTGKTSASLAGGWKMDTMYIYGDYTMGGVKLDSVTGTSPASSSMDRSDNAIDIGIVNSHKKDGTDFFYGVEFRQVTAKEDATVAQSLGAGTTKITTTTLPLFAGVEAEAASWLVLRGSISQTLGFLGLAKVKNENSTNGDTETTGADNTTVSAGAGIKWNKFTFDSVLAASSSGTGTFGTDGANFMTNASLTYMF